MSAFICGRVTVVRAEFGANASPLLGGLVPVVAMAHSGSLMMSQPSKRSTFGLAPAACATGVTTFAINPASWVESATIGAMLRTVTPLFTAVGLKLSKEKRVNTR